MHLVMVFREAGKQRRRQRILAAARALIIEQGTEALHMRTLSTRGEVSPRTLYNLFAGKADIIAAITNDRLDALDEELQALQVSDPLDRSKAVIDLAIDHCAADSALYAPLLAYAYANIGPRVANPVFRRARTFQQTALQEAIERRMLQKRFSAAQLAHQMLASYNQAAWSWAKGFLDIDEFRAHALHAWGLLLLGVATPKTRERLLVHLEVLGAQVDQSLAKAAADEQSPTNGGQGPNRDN